GYLGSGYAGPARRQPELCREPAPWYASLKNGATRGRARCRHFPEGTDECRPAPPDGRGDQPPDPAAGLPLTSPPSHPSATNSTPRWASPASGTPPTRPRPSSPSSSRSTAC